MLSPNALNHAVDVITEHGSLRLYGLFMVMAANVENQSGEVKMLQWEIAEKLGLKEKSNISSGLKRLAEIGLLERRESGFYALAPRLMTKAKQGKRYTKPGQHLSEKRMAQRVATMQTY